MTSTDHPATPPAPWEADGSVELCDHVWETDAIFGDGYQGLQHYERRCARCSAYQEINNGKVVAGWW